MKSNCFRAFFVALALLAVSSAAFADPGDLEAVEHYCGPPTSESRNISRVTNQLDRTLIYYNTYNYNVYLVFQPVDGGWSFISSWNSQMPMTREELEHRLPCFRNAMNETATQRASHGAFSIPHLWLIVALVITLLLFLLLPSARQRRAAHLAREPIERVYRTPNLDEYIPPSHQLVNRDLN